MGQGEATAVPRVGPIRPADGVWKWWLRKDQGKAADLGARCRWRMGEVSLGKSRAALEREAWVAKGGTRHWLEEQRSLAMAVSGPKQGNTGWGSGGTGRPGAQKRLSWREM